MLKDATRIISKIMFKDSKRLRINAKNAVEAPIIIVRVPIIDRRSFSRLKLFLPPFNSVTSAYLYFTEIYFTHIPRTVKQQNRNIGTNTTVYFY